MARSLVSAEAIREQLGAESLQGPRSKASNSPLGRGPTFAAAADGSRSPLRQKREDWLKRSDTEETINPSTREDTTLDREGKVATGGTNMAREITRY